MPPPGRARSAPWLSGALTLLAAAALAAPVLYAFGLHRWPFFVGALVLALLLLGAVERRWQSRALPRPHRPVDRSRFRVVEGGKGNGHAHDAPPPGGDDPDDKPRWVM
jgi:hypothetical protein